jgi:transcriptional regulator with XRE-family HTH domain
MDPDYARAFRIIRAAFGLKQSELAARMSVSVSQLSLIESGKRNPSVGVIDALARAVKIPGALVSLLAASADELGDRSNREVSELAGVLLKLLVPGGQTRTGARMKKNA